MVGAAAKRPTRQMRILKTSAAGTHAVYDTLVLETPITIFLNDVELVTLMCSPTNLEELAVGFLFTEGVIAGKRDIRSVVSDYDEGAVWLSTKGPKKKTRDLLSRRLITTGCGRGLSFRDASGIKLRVHSRLKIRADGLFALMRDFQRRSELFKQTGGVHSAALCDSSGILVLREDIGRHSAVDKVIGHCILAEMPMKDTILVTSGRISSEMLIKAARAGIPLIMSKSAPTVLGVSLAKEFGVTLVGFVRGSRMNIYSDRKRVT